MGRSISRGLKWLAVVVAATVVVLTAVQLLGQPIPPQPASNARSNIQLEITKPVDGEVVQRDHITISGKASRNAAVEINGVPVQLDRGYFNLEVALRRGENTFAAVASVIGLDSATAKVTVVRIDE